VTVSVHLSDAYCHVKIAADMADRRGIYAIDGECRDALVSIAFAAIELGLDDGPWAPANDLAD
jgi:hypothetical protein